MSVIPAESKQKQQCLWTCVCPIVSVFHVYSQSTGPTRLSVNLYFPAFGEQKSFALEYYNTLRNKNLFNKISIIAFLY